MDDFEDLAEKRKQIEERDKRLADRESADFRKVLSFVEGRRFVWNLLGRLQLTDMCFNTNALVMGKNAALGDEARKLFKAIPTATFIQMQREQESDLKSEKKKT